MEFSGDKETIFCGTTSGDFGLINVRLKKLMKTVRACRLGILSLLSWPEGVICGGENEMRAEEKKKNYHSSYWSTNTTPRRRRRNNNHI